MLKSDGVVAIGRANADDMWRATSHGLLDPVANLSLVATKVLCHCGVSVLGIGKSSEWSVSNFATMLGGKFTC